MSVLVAAATVAAALVIVAGASKVLHPAAARRQLVLAGGRRLPLTLVRAIGVGELGLGLAVLLLGGPVATGLLAVTYLGFLGVALLQRAAGRGCGCMGATSGRVGPTHLVLDAVGALVLGLAALQGQPAPATLLPGGIAAVVTVALLGVATGLSALLLTRLPELTSLQAEVRAGAAG